MIDRAARIVGSVWTFHHKPTRVVCTANAVALTARNLGSGRGRGASRSMFRAAKYAVPAYASDGAGRWSTCPFGARSAGRPGLAGVRDLKTAVIGLTRQMRGPSTGRIGSASTRSAGHIVTETRAAQWECANPRWLALSLKSSHRSRELGRPVDIANAIGSWFSDEASFITGQALAVDGGLTCSCENLGVRLGSLRPSAPRHVVPLLRPMRVYGQTSIGAAGTPGRRSERPGRVRSVVLDDGLGAVSAPRVPTGSGLAFDVLVDPGHGFGPAEHAGRASLAIRDRLPSSWSAEYRDPRSCPGLRSFSGLMVTGALTTRCSAAKVDATQYRTAASRLAWPPWPDRHHPRAIGRLRESGAPQTPARCG